MTWMLLSWGGVADARPDTDEVAAELLGRALASEEAWTELRYLADRIGSRPAGSKALEEAVAWAAAEMREDGLRVTLEPVEVPHWVRGGEKAEIVAPRPLPIDVLTLGGSVATPQGGLTADVLVVSSFEELESRSAEAEGRIVVWDVPFTTYGETVQYRLRGADAAARWGGVASLVRSVTPESLDTPHTGMMRYEDPDVAKVPAAAVTLEVATWLHRLQDAGVTPRIHLELTPEMRGTALSHNVVGEVRGRNRNEIVVIGCHLDAWDVGQGAQDDGSGCTNVMEVGRHLAALPFRPLRTVRVVLYTNEENGLSGATAYAAAHADDAFFAVLEDDSGAGEPLGFGVDIRGTDGMDEAATRDVIATLTPHLHGLATIGADALVPGGSGADVGQLVPLGAVGFGVRHDMSGYWPIHHTEADTLEKIDPMALRRINAATTVMTWLLADLEAIRGG